MRNSRRIKRMGRNRLKIGKMNLTSLMDVFTILVFFLLVNSGSVEVLESPKDVKLPESRIESKPRETVVISISAEEVLVQGKLVAFVEDILSRQGRRHFADQRSPRRVEGKRHWHQHQDRCCQPGSYDPGRSFSPVHRRQDSHVDVHGRGLRERIAGGNPESDPGSERYLAPHG